MSEGEEDKRSYSSSSSKSLKIKRLSIEVDVTALVESGKLLSKSKDLSQKERFLADYDRELDSIDERKKIAEQELHSYTTLQSNMDSYIANELTVDMGNDEHRAMVAFMKVHVS